MQLIPTWLGGDIVIWAGTWRKGCKVRMTVTKGTDEEARGPDRLRRLCGAVVSDRWWPRAGAVAEAGWPCPQRHPPPSLPTGSQHHPSVNEAQIASSPDPAAQPCPSASPRGCPTSSSKPPRSNLKSAPPRPPPAPPVFSAPVSGTTVCSSSHSESRGSSVHPANVAVPLSRHRRSQWPSAPFPGLTAATGASEVQV